MAKVEFYEIVIKDKITQEVVTNISLSEEIIKKLKINHEHDNFCQKRNCAVILNEYLKVEDGITTFDFSKLTDEKVISTLISEPSKAEDTFDKLDKKILETTKYSKKNEVKVREIISRYENQFLIDELKKLSIDKFKVYKIILDNKELINKDELAMFKKQIIKRLKKDSLFFQVREIIDGKKVNLLAYQNLLNGLDIKFLEDYLNTHLLIDSSFKINFHKLYDATFMDLLQNGELTNFIFSYNIENKSNLLNNGLFNPFYAIGSLFGNNTTEIVIKPEKDELLDNQKLLDFFEKATEAGLLDSCELKAKGYKNKKIDFKDKKLMVEYSKSINIEDLHGASDFFDEALIQRKNIITKRLKV